MKGECMAIFEAGKGAFVGDAQPLPAAAPLDLSHLARQTLDDREIEVEVLTLFVRQATLARQEILSATIEERRRLAHTIKGSALGIGAFAVADAAVAIEANPWEDDLSGLLAARIREACDFIASLHC